ncbi:Hypothetical protein HVR_LOCUS1023 [uncultured virus]|nr:Hypothetical protein HVR_LOCUS1023 [uncultured virus]
MSVYILSSLALPGRCKVGKHNGTLGALRTRYITAIPDLQINYFIQTPHAHEVESTFKSTYEHYRIPNVNNNLSEWVELPFESVFQILIVIIAKFDIKIEKETKIINYSVIPQNIPIPVTAGKRDRPVINELTTLITNFNIYETNDKPIFNIYETNDKPIFNCETTRFVYNDFIQDLCVLGNDKRILTSDLHRYYVQYTGIKADSSKLFRRNMEHRFSVRKNNNNYYHGIGIDIIKLNERNGKAAGTLYNTSNKPLISKMRTPQIPTKSLTH